MYDCTVHPLAHPPADIAFAQLAFSIGLLLTP